MKTVHKWLTYLVVGAPLLLLPIFIILIVVEPEGGPVIRIDLSQGSDPEQMPDDIAPIEEEVNPPRGQPIGNVPKLKVEPPKVDRDKETIEDPLLAPAAEQPDPNFEPLMMESELTESQRRRLEWLESALGNE